MSLCNNSIYKSPGNLSGDDALRSSATKIATWYVHE